MKEYIERESVEKMLEDAQLISDGEYCGYCTEDINLSSIPAADVVEVTFCKDCRYYQDAKVNEKGFLICPASGMEITEMDYCSYGQRKIETVLPKNDTKDESLEETHANTRKNAR